MLWALGEPRLAISLLDSLLQNAAERLPGALCCAVSVALACKRAAERRRAAALYCVARDVQSCEPSQTSQAAPLTFKPYPTV